MLAKRFARLNGPQIVEEQRCWSVVYVYYVMLIFAVKVAVVPLLPRERQQRIISACKMMDAINSAPLVSWLRGRLVVSERIVSVFYWWRIGNNKRKFM